MSQAKLATGPDRLPWLDDEIRPAGGDRKRNRLVVGGAAVAAIAALSFWLGAHGWGTAEPASTVGMRSTTVALPPASPPAQPEVPIVERQPQIIQVVQPVVRQAPQPEVKIAKPAAEAPTTASAVAAAASAAPAVTVPAPVATAVRPVAKSGPLTVWPARVCSRLHSVSRSPRVRPMSQTEALIDSPNRFYASTRRERREGRR